MSSNPYRPGFANKPGSGSGLPDTSGATPGDVLVWVGPNDDDFEWVTLTSPYGIIGASFDGAASVLEVGRFADVIVPGNCTIKECEIIVNPSGSIEFSITKTTYAAFPGSMSSIVGANPPKVITAVKSLDTILTGWSPALLAGDILRIQIASVTAVTKAMLALKVLK